MNDVGVWCVLWSYRGHQPWIDFWDRDDAYDFAQRIAESPDRSDPQVFQHEIPGPSPETKARIVERIQREINGRALMSTLKEQRP